MPETTGCRDSAGVSANRSLVPKVWPRLRIRSRMLSPSPRGLKRCKCSVIQPSGLPDRGADHDLKDLVLAEARFPRGCDVLVGDLVGMFGNPIDQRTYRFG